MNPGFPQFYDDSQQQMPLCAKMISSWVRKVLSICKTHMSLGTLRGVVAVVALVSDVYIARQFLVQPDTFQHI